MGRGSGRFESSVKSHGPSVLAGVYIGGDAGAATRQRETVMEQFKQFILRHFEKILVGVILIAAFVGTYFVEEKFIVLNFYYLPVLDGRVFSRASDGGPCRCLLHSCSVDLCLGLSSNVFFPGKEILKGVAQLSSWGGFLILASFTVGTLYERNEQRLKELKNAYIGVLEILSKYLESTDRYTKGHSVRVAELATEIATAMELPRPEVENIRVAGLLHDIGKIEISGEILRKAAALSSEEREIMDSHT